MINNNASTKENIRSMMQPIRLQLLCEHSGWIQSFEPIALGHMADGEQVIPESIDPALELVETPLEMNLWRYCRFLSSMPYSNYVGRRMYFLVRDNALPSRPIMGIAAIGSCVMQIADRDRWIGWDRDTKRERIVYMMDLYTSIAIPPYSDLLTGKLILYMMVSNEVRALYARKYSTRKTESMGRTARDLVLLSSTTIYGQRSSLFNRVKYKGQPLYMPVGETSGFGTFHISPASFREMRDYLEERGIDPSPRLSAGLNWRMRVARIYFQTCVGQARAHLNHGYKRGVFLAPLAHNARDFLCGRDLHPDYYNWPLRDLVQYWRARWLDMRLQNPEIVGRVREFRREQNALSVLSCGHGRDRVVFQPPLC